MDIKLRDLLCMVQGAVTIELPVSKTIITLDGYSLDVLAKDVLDLNIDYIKAEILKDGTSVLYICLEED